MHLLGTQQLLPLTKRKVPLSPLKALFQVFLFFISTIQHVFSWNQPSATLEKMALTTFQVCMGTQGFEFSTTHSYKCFKSLVKKSRFLSIKRNILKSVESETENLYPTAPSATMWLTDLFLFFKIYIIYHNNISDFWYTDNICQENQLMSGFIPLMGFVENKRNTLSS